MSKLLHRWFGHTYHYMPLHTQFRCDCGELRKLIDGEFERGFSKHDQIATYRA